MHGTPFPKITIFGLICLVLICQAVFGQKNANAEVDVSKCWSYSLGDTSGEQVAVDENGVYLALDGGKVEALSRDGKKIWSSEFGGEIRSNFVGGNGNLFFATSAVSGDTRKPGGSKLRWVSKETGITNWTMALPEAARHYMSEFGGAIIVVSKNGTIESVDAKSGNVKWTRQIAEGFVAEPAFAVDRVIVATAGNKIYEVNLASGEIDSIGKTSYGITALGLGPNSELVTGDERGNISVLNETGKPIWKFKAGGKITDIIKIADNFLVASQDNFVYFLAARNGGRVWKRRLMGRIGPIGKVTDSLALISTFEERGSVFLDLLNGRVVGQLIFAENESLVSPPVIANGMILMLTNSAVHTYALTGCSAEKTKAAANP